LTVTVLVNTIRNVNILVILAHPDMSSFNHAIAEAAVSTLEKNGHKVISHDLYREGFDGVLPKLESPKGAVVSPVIGTYCSELAKTDGIIIVHPNWWGQPPAILKGYIDRVFRPGVAYEFTEGDSGEGVPAGLLRAKAAIVFNAIVPGTRSSGLVFITFPIIDFLEIPARTGLLKSLNLFKDFSNI